MNSVPSSSKDCLVRFSFKNGDEDLQMETGFDKLSEMVAKRIRECGENPGELLIEIDKEWSRLHIELMNKFTKKFFEKHAKALDRCERSEDKSKFWMDFVVCKIILSKYKIFRPKITSILQKYLRMYTKTI
jgi:hypothetical protein